MTRIFILAAAFAISSHTCAQADLDTITYVSFDGEGRGKVEGDFTGVQPVTLLDSEGGDMGNGGDQYIYLHQDSQLEGSFVATVRVVSQTETIDGRWGKAGIRASANLTGTSPFAMTVVATGNGSQLDAPESGSEHSPVPVRLTGRENANGMPDGGFERPVFSDAAYDGSTLGAPFVLAGERNVVANDVFPNSATPNASWLTLEYAAATNTFTAGYALDKNGTPGVWNYSDPFDSVPADEDGWYIGLAYSAHNSMNFDQISPEFDRMHGVTFDNFSLASIPEPSANFLILFGLPAFISRYRKGRSINLAVSAARD